MPQAYQRAVGTYDISFPSHGSEARQDEEFCHVQLDQGRRRIRFHDYAEIYAEPGLYEQLFYQELRCESPWTVVGLLKAALDVEGEAAEDLRVLDIGAGNGMVGEELAELGVSELLGVDIIDAAAEATERDRPDLYSEYLVADLANLSDEERRAIEDFAPNCLVSVAALGFGDIPPQAFAGAFALLDDGDWLAFCLKEDFLEDDDASGFARLIARALDEGVLEVVARQRYRHRFSAAGEPLYYVALVARRQGRIPHAWAVRAHAESEA